MIVVTYLTIALSVAAIAMSLLNFWATAGRDLYCHGCGKWWGFPRKVKGSDKGHHKAQRCKYCNSSSQSYDA